MVKRLVLLICLFDAASLAAAQERPAPEEPEPVAEEEISEPEERRADDASLTEDPEEQRRALEEQRAEDLSAAPEEKREFEFEWYGSARVHGINTFNVESGDRTFEVSDGNSRVGFRADWRFSPERELFGRAEFGIDLVERFSTRGDLEGDGGLTDRLLFAGFDSENLTLVFGKNWSAYYKVAGNTDRFAIFGGSASGTYNAGTSGQATGTGRADDVFQARVYVDNRKWLGLFKPFNLNLQYQLGQPIPELENEKYIDSFGASAWLETQSELGIGIGYNRARIRDPERPEIRAAGIDGDAKALAISTRAFGDRWYVSVLYSNLENMEVTDQGRYFNAHGFELYAQWEFRKEWWLIGGTNILEPAGDDPDVGQFRTRYHLIGGRYTFDSFHRMIYFEYRIDESRLFDGTPGEDELTIGVRWDFGYD